MNNESESNEIDLLHLLMALLKKWWLLALSIVLGAVLAFGYTKFLCTPKYEASAYMYVNTNSVSVGSTKISLSDLNAAQSLVDTYAVILERRLTLEKVIEEAHLDYTYEQLHKMVKASAVNSTEIFEIRVTDSDPQEACLIANTIAEVLPNRISSVIEGCSVSIVDVAVVPTTPTSPNYMKNMAIGMMIGFVICAAIIVLLDIFNDTIDSVDWITSTYGEEFPLLAECPDTNQSSSHRYGRYGGKYGKYGYSKNSHYYSNTDDNNNATRS